MFLDTSGLLCCFDADEDRHSEATRRFQAASRRVVSSYVLAEFLPLRGARKLPRRRTLDFLNDPAESPRVEVAWVDEFLHRAAMALLEQRQDKTYSVCDAVGFLLMRRYGIVEALTTDRHFEQEGFRRLLP